MTTTPDHAAIDWVLENVPGARPTRDGSQGDGVELRHDADWQCAWYLCGTNTVDEYAHRDDALAILRDWWCEWVRAETERQWRRSGDTHAIGEIKYRRMYGEDVVYNAGTHGAHLDRTTALALLVRRAYEAGKET